METINFSRKRGAFSRGRVANTDDQIGRDALRGKKLEDVLRVLAAGVDSNLPQSLDGEGMHPSRRLSSGRQALVAFPCHLPEQGLGHLAAASVSSAKEEDTSLGFFPVFQLEARSLKPVSYPGVSLTGFRAHSSRPSCTWAVRHRLQWGTREENL